MNMSISLFYLTHRIVVDVAVGQFRLYEWWTPDNATRSLGEVG